MPPMSGTMYRWTSIEAIPAKPGIYAWYYLLNLTDRDVTDIVERVESRKQGGQPEAAASAVRDFLNDYVFQYFAEEPYQALIEGALKPKYEGEIEHTPYASQSLVNRLVEAPERLWTLKKVLEEAVPVFSSPIYIGMSDNLKRRLTTHKRLISGFKEQSSPSGPSKDKNFARRVVSRGLISSRLRVSIAVVSVENSQYVDAENVLNRINYPLLGKN